MNEDLAARYLAGDPLEDAELALLLDVHRDTARAHLQAAGLTPCGTDQRGNPVYLSSRAVREIVRRTK